MGCLSRNEHREHKHRYEEDESAEIICSKCGQVISDKVEQEGPEWRNFDLLSSGDQSNASKNRVGRSRSLALHDMGLSTIIGRTDIDASGQNIDAAMRSIMDRKTEIQRLAEA